MANQLAMVFGANAEVVAELIGALGIPGAAVALEIPEKCREA